MTKRNVCVIGVGMTKFERCDRDFTELCRRDIEANGLSATIESTLSRRAAIDGADYVICTIRHGGLEAFQSDIDIPLKYGVDQCVGDTLCIGGIMYGQRNIAAILAAASLAGWSRRDIGT